MTDLCLSPVRIRSAVLIVLAPAIMLAALRYEARGQARDPNAKARRTAAIKMAHAENIGEFLTQQLWQSDDDGLYLEGMLSSLHAAGDGDLQSFELLSSMARRNWRRPDGDGPRAYVERVLGEVKGLKTGDAARLFEAAESYKQHSGHDWRYDWRGDSQPWFDLAAAMIDAGQRDRGAATWRDLARIHPKQANLYRLAYLAALAARRKKVDDREFIAPLWDEEVPTDRRLRHQAVVLSVLAASGEAADSEYRASLRKSLLKLARHQADDPSSLAALAFLYTRPEAQVEREAVQAELLKHAKPRMFSHFARRANLGKPLRRRLFLGKVVEIDQRDAPCKVVIGLLQAEVDLPLWIDEAVRADDAPITIRRRGRWLDVLTAALEQSPYELAMLRDGVMWIGPPERRDAARALVRASVGKLPSHIDPHSRQLAESLREPTHVQFLSVPLSDVCDYLADLHNVPIHLAGDEPHPDTVSLRLHGLPLYLVLEVLCRRAEVDWCVAGPFVVIGKAKQVQAGRSAAEDFRLKLTCMELDESPLRATLDEETMFEFIETPLVDVVDYLNALHDGLPLELGEGAARDLPISAQHRRTPFGWTLELVLLEYGLKMRYEGGGLIISRRPQREKKPPDKQPAGASGGGSDK